MTEGIAPDTLRFFGKPIEDGFVSGVLGSWFSGQAGSKGRGIMYSAQAGYVTREGEHRRINWPVLVSLDARPGAELGGQIAGIGPPQDLSMADTPDTFDEANMQFNEHHLEWLFDQDVTTVVRELDCPDTGCDPSQCGRAARPATTTSDSRRDLLPGTPPSNHRSQPPRLRDHRL